MATFYTIDRANARLSEVRELLLLLRTQREELIELRDRLVALTGDGRDGLAGRPGAEPDLSGAEDGGPGGATPAGSTAAGTPAAGTPAAGTPEPEPAKGAESTPGAQPAPGPQPAAGAGGDDGSTLTGLEQARLIRLRMKGIVDQMGASVSRIDAWGITLRDIESGLIDFPALVSGRQVWLCWRLGEGDVAWWHELDTGFGGRRRLEDLE